MRREVGLIPGALVVAAVLLTGSTGVSAQATGRDTLRLTYEDLLTRIATGSPELARQRLEVERAVAARRGISFFPSLPELEYATHSDLPFENAGEGGWELELTQEIEIGGQYFLRNQAADLSLRQSELELRAVELTLRAEAASAYARLAAAEARVRLLDTLLMFSRRLDTIAGRLLAAEEISELDRNTVRIQRGSAELERLAAVGEISQSAAELSGLLALAPRTTITTAPGSLDRSFRPAEVLDTLGRIESALASGDLSMFERRPDWQALDRARDRIQSERSLVSRAWIPNLRVGLGYIEETSVLKGEDLTGSVEFRQAFGELRSKGRLLGLRLGIALPLPFPGLYDLGQGRIAQADVELSIIEAERNRLAARIRADLVRVTGRLRAASDAYTLYTVEIAPLISRNLELLERGYRAGELSATDVVTRQEQFFRIGESLIEAQREYWESLADFQRAVGG